MISNKSILTLSVLLIDSVCLGQKSDSLINNNTDSPSNITSYFRQFSGGINAVYSNKESKGGVDMAIQTYHYYMITGRRQKSDSLHKKLVTQKTPIAKLYKGFQFLYPE